MKVFIADGTANRVTSHRATGSPGQSEAIDTVVRATLLVDPKAGVKVEMHGAIILILGQACAVAHPSNDELASNMARALLLLITAPHRLKDQ